MKIVKQLPAGEYTVIEVSEKTSFGNYAVIDGKEYATEIAYDLPNCIGIKGSEDFAGKDVSFHD